MQRAGKRHDIKEHGAIGENVFSGCGGLSGAAYSGSKAPYPVTLDGVPFLPEGYRAEQAADGYYYLRQN